ncbi:MAG: nuclear transport factor 2 family protein [Pseudomonadota bacterium]
MSFDGPIEDRLAIRELIDAYSDAVARRDADAWIATWVDDATWDLMGHIVEGRETILQTWLVAMSTFDFVAFHAAPGAIEIEGDQAAVRVYVSEALVPNEGGLRRIEGAYEDICKKVDGAWRFASRAYKILYEETKAEGAG